MMNFGHESRDGPFWLLRALVICGITLTFILLLPRAAKADSENNGVVELAPVQANFAFNKRTEDGEEYFQRELIGNAFAVAAAQYLNCGAVEPELVECRDEPKEFMLWQVTLITAYHVIVAACNEAQIQGSDVRLSQWREASQIDNSAVNHKRWRNDIRIKSSWCEEMLRQPSGERPPPDFFAFRVLFAAPPTFFMNPFVLSSLKTKDAAEGTQYYLSGFQPADMASDLSQYTDFSKNGSADEILASWNVTSGWEGIASYNPPNETQDEADANTGKKRNFTAPSTLSRAVRGGMSGSPIVRKGSMHVVGVLVENLPDIDLSRINQIRTQCRATAIPNGTADRTMSKRDERIAIAACMDRSVRKLENSQNAYFFGLEPMDFLQRILDARIHPSSEEALHKIREASNTQSRLLDPNIAEINQQFLEPITNHMFEIDRNAELVLNIGRSIPIRTFGTTPSAKRNKAAFVAMYCRLSPISRRFIFDLIKSKPPNDPIKDSLINEVVTFNQCP